MEFFPQLEFGLLNGLVFIIIFGLIELIIIMTCPKDVKLRLFDRKNWTKTQIILTGIGKVFSIINLILIVFMPLKIGTVEFLIGLIFFLIGLTGFAIALFNFKNAPLNQPITSGLYKISRNPQMVMMYLIFFGMILMIGSWFNLILLVTSISCVHFSILAEEKRLTEQYKEQYLEYKKKVSRYFLFF